MYWLVLKFFLPLKDMKPGAWVEVSKMLRDHLGVLRWQCGALGCWGEGVELQGAGVTVRGSRGLRWWCGALGCWVWSSTSLPHCWLWWAADDQYSILLSFVREHNLASNPCKISFFLNLSQLIAFHLRSHLVFGLIWLELFCAGCVFPPQFECYFPCPLVPMVLEFISPSALWLFYPRSSFNSSCQTVRTVFILLSSHLMGFIL